MVNEEFFNGLLDLVEDEATDQEILTYLGKKFIEKERLFKILDSFKYLPIIWNTRIKKEVNK